MIRLSLILVTVFLVGCHARFKRYAPTLGDVSVQTLVVAGPSVDLGHVAPPPPPQGQPPNVIAEAAAAAANIASDIEAARIAGRLARVVEPPALARELEGTVGNVLGGGPPFAYVPGQGPAGGKLEIQITNYGLFVEGSQPVFRIDLGARIYRAGDGKRVYSHAMSCSSAQGGGAWGPWGQLAGIAAAVALIESMNDNELRGAVLQAAQTCAGNFVSAMRRHAS